MKHGKGISVFIFKSQLNRLCLYTLRMISNHTERTFGRLRYLLGGDRPSQTAHLTLSPSTFSAAG